VANYAKVALNGGTTSNTLLDFDVPANDIAWQISGSCPRTPAYNAGVLYAVNDNPLRLEAPAEADGSLHTKTVSRLSETRSDLCPEAFEVLRIPGVKHFSICLQGALTDHHIVASSADNPLRCCALQRFEELSFIKRNQRESISDII